MRTLSRFLSYVSAAFSILIALKPPPAAQLVKTVANMVAPFVLLGGIGGGVLNWLRGDRKTAAAGFVAAAIAGRYIAQTTTSHDKFDVAFGPDWRTRIPHRLHKRMLTSRRAFSLPRPLNVRWQPDISLGILPDINEPLLADLWEPPADVPHSGLGIIYLHGSGWHYMDKDFYTRSFFRHLASQGHVLLDVAYTMCPRGQLREQLSDVKRAIAWMKSNAEQLGVNPERIVLIGASAGGHLGLLAAYTPNYPEFQPADVIADTSVRAVVSYYGVANLRDMQMFMQTAFGNMPGGGLFDMAMDTMLRRARFIPSYGKYIAPVKMIPALTGGTLDEVPDAYRLGSPITYVTPDCPPTLLFQGAHDFDGIVLSARILHQQLRDAGVQSIYIEYPNTGHAFDIPINTPAGLSALYDTERFLSLMV